MSPPWPINGYVLKTAELHQMGIYMFTPQMKPFSLYDFLMDQLVVFHHGKETICEPQNNDFYLPACPFILFSY